MPSPVRSMSGDSGRKNPTRQRDSNASGRRSSAGGKLAMPSLVRNRSGDSVGRRSPLRGVRRTESGDSSKGSRGSRSFKKTRGFDREISFCITDSIRNSPILSRPPEASVTFYNPEHVARGRKYMHGKFFDILHVKYLPSQEEVELIEAGESEPLYEDDDDDELAGSDHKNSHDNNAKKYFLKQVSHKHSREKQMFQLATIRLVLEAKYLARLSHPNLVQPKGITIGEEKPLLNGNSCKFFMVMDRMVESLEERIERWQRETVDEGPFDFNSPANQQKMMYAIALAEVLKYLHDQNLVVLNLRPENIGFTEDDTIQIRDLSCCREIAGDTCTKDDPLGFICDLKVKGEAGESQMAAAKSNFLVLEAIVEGQPRPRYVAPEAIMEHEYTPAADTYSWAHILFFMLSLSKPYAAYKLGQLLTKVCLEGSRPNLSVYRFPQELQHLLQISWRASYSKRPTMKALLEAIPLLMKMSAKAATSSPAPEAV